MKFIKSIKISFNVNGKHFALNLNFVVLIERVLRVLKGKVQNSNFNTKVILKNIKLDQSQSRPLTSSGLDKKIIKTTCCVPMQLATYYHNIQIYVSIF